MESTNPSDVSKGMILAEDDPVLQRALELTRRNSLRRTSLAEILSRAPKDWAPGEADVEEFLDSIRGRGSHP